MSQPSTLTVAMQNTQIAGPVVEQIISHLKDEKASLEAMLTAVRDVNHALIHLNDDSLRMSLEAEARELCSNAAIQQRRHQLQDELAALLQIDPRDVTLRRLAGATTGYRRLIRTLRCPPYGLLRPLPVATTTKNRGQTDASTRRTDAH